MRFRPCLNWRIKTSINNLSTDFYGRFKGWENNKFADSIQLRYSQPPNAVWQLKTIKEIPTHDSRSLNKLNYMGFMLNDKESYPFEY